jgi:hypothetical protein
MFSDSLLSLFLLFLFTFVSFDFCCFLFLGLISSLQPGIISIIIFELFMIYCCGSQKNQRNLFITMILKKCEGPIKNVYMFILFYRRSSQKNIRICKDIVFRFIIEYSSLRDFYRSLGNKY